MSEGLEAPDDEIVEEHGANDAEDEDDVVPLDPRRVGASPKATTNALAGDLRWIPIHQMLFKTRRIPIGFAIVSRTLSPKRQRRVLTATIVYEVDVIYIDY